MDKSRTMIGVVLPGNGTVESNEFTTTAAGPGPILLEIPTINLEKASEAYRVAAEQRGGRARSPFVFDQALSSWTSSPEADHA
jgi:hypothetical protein